MRAEAGAGGERRCTFVTLRSRPDRRGIWADHANPALSRSADLATFDAACPRHLRSNGDVSQKRTIRAGQSDSASCGFGPEQHRRRAGAHVRTRALLSFCLRRGALFTNCKRRSSWLATWDSLAKTGPSPSRVRLQRSPARSTNWPRHCAHNSQDFRPALGFVFPASSFRLPASSFQLR